MPWQAAPGETGLSFTAKLKNHYLYYLTIAAQPTHNPNSANKHRSLTLYLPKSGLGVNHSQPSATEKGKKGSRGYAMACSPWRNRFKLYSQIKKPLPLLPNYPSPTHPQFELCK
jgi:hypothetical protein